MASPKNITTRNLTGKFTMNKTLSDDTDEVLTLQGIGWITRKAIGLATITLDIKQYRDDEGVEHIDIEQTATGGIKGTTENRTLDWTERPHEDHLFGKLVAKSRRLEISEVEAGFLSGNFLPEAKDDGVVESFVVNNDNHWSAQQIWGFEEISSVRYYVRHLRFRKFEDSVANTPEKVIDRKMVYDYSSTQ